MFEANQEFVLLREPSLVREYYNQQKACCSEQTSKICGKLIAVSARLLDLGLKLYPGKMQRMLNKELPQFKQSLFENTKVEKANERLC